MLELSPLETAAKACARSHPGLDQHLPVEALPDHLLAAEVRAEPTERLRVLVDHGDLVAQPLQPRREGGPDPTASHDHDVHRDPPRVGENAIASGPVATALGFTRVQAPHGGQAHPRRAAAAQRSPGPHPAPEADRAARLRLRRDVLGRLRARGDLPDAVRGRPRAPTCSRRGSAWPSWSCCSPWWPATGRTCTPTRPAGGDYEVATVNLGRRAGLTVASALLVDYTLTVAVSISAAAANVGALIPLRRRAQGELRGAWPSCC